MALSLWFHIVFASVGIAMPVLMAAANRRCAANRVNEMLRRLRAELMIAEGGARRG
jgi:cytochrome bd-type quinol oxidase subunit 1